MSKKDSGTVKETEAERALAQNALERLADYRQRWAPVQQRLASEIRAMGKEGSFERKQLAGKVVGDTRAAFTRAGEAAEAQQRNAGIDAGSSKFKLGVTEAGNDEAQSVGMGIMGADQAIDDAYVQGLGAIMSMGRGTQASAQQNLTSLAGIQANQAAADAQASAARRTGNMRLAGTAIGVGAGAAMGAKPGINPKDAQYATDAYAATGIQPGMPHVF